MGAYGPFLFFIISGFLAAKSLCDKEPHVLTYYKKRALTILPLYYAVIILVFLTDALEVFSHFITIPQDSYHLAWLRYIFLLNGVVDADVMYWANLAGTWTIHVFAFFYLIAPFAFRPINSLGKAFIAWCLCAVGYALLNALILKPNGYRSTACENLHVFFLGGLLYWTTRQRREIVTALLFGVLALLMLALRDIKWVYLMLFSLITVLCVSLEEKIRPSVMTRRIISYVDAHSYSLYLMHTAFIYCVIRRFLINNAPWEIGIILILGTIVFTWIGHNLIEVPIRRLVGNRYVPQEGSL